MSEPPTALVPVASLAGPGAAGQLGAGLIGEPERHGAPPARPRRFCWSPRFLLSEGPARERTAELAASGPSGCAPASAAPALPAGQERRAAGGAGWLSQSPGPQGGPLGRGRQAQSPAPRPVPSHPGRRCSRPVAPRRACAQPSYALAPSALYGLAAWPRGRPWRHGCPLWLLIGAVRGGVWGLHTMPRECCSLHTRCFLEVLESP